MEAQMFRVCLKICSPDSFSATPVGIQGFKFPGQEECLKRLSDCLASVVPSHYTQNHSGGKAGVRYDGVSFGLQRGGRCLIADEMGLGKTLQAIAIAGCFMCEGSILVVCPAILRYSWVEELERWLPFCLPADIHLVFGHENNPANLKKWPRIVVISYTMLHHLQKSMLDREWALLIVDESHHVRCTKKKSEPKEIQVVLDVARKVKHCVLLSGTPSLSML